MLYMMHIKGKLLKADTIYEYWNWVYQNFGIDSYVHSSFHDYIAVIRLLELDYVIPCTAHWVFYHCDSVH
jgi:hypothetical protein